MTELAFDPELVPAGNEREVLDSFLGYYRTVFIRKAEGIDEQQARTTVPPSDLTLLGLVRHMAEVERNWFRRRFAGLDAPPLFYGPHDEDGDLHAGPDDTLAGAFAALAAEITFAEDAAANAESLDVLAPRLLTARDPDWQPNLRWILVHMIEEYARHCGHADLLRERIDGQKGD
jgi:hypothetical protein